jgi:type VI secretion system secreted protein VgrG
MSGSTSTTPKDSYAKITISPDPGFELVFDGMKMIDELGRPFEIDLDVSSPKPKGDLSNILGATVSIAFQQPGRPDRNFSARLTRLRYIGLTGGAYRYRLELRPWVWLLSQTHDCKIFQKQSAFAIINSVFKDAGFSDVSDKRSLRSGETVLEYCVQYRETSLDFVTRLMEEFGIYYYFEHTASAHTLVLADDLSSHKAITPDISYQRQMTEARSTKDHVWDFNSDLQLQPSACTFLDYNFTTPSADLTVKSIDSAAQSELSAEMYDYPGFYDTVENGKKLIEVRMEDLTARRHTLGGTTNARALQVGVKFTLSNHPDTSMNQDYLITGCTTTFGAGESRSAAGGDLVDSYRCIFHAIPGKVPFRLDNKTPRPMIRGPQTARVVGASGDEITTDEYGRIKLKFPWDRSSAQDDTASCWVRVAQLWAGTQFGAMFIPRVGQEVIVEFLEGNPDRPIVTGRVYNASVKVPYALPGEKTKSTIKSNSSTGGGGFNELRFEDKKGSEEIFINAQKDYNETVLNNKTVKITQDSTTTIDKGNHSLTISTGNQKITVSQGDQTTTISAGKHSTTVSAKDHELTVSAGNHKITISAGKSDISAAQSITLTVGSSSIKIAPDGITLSAAQIKLSGTATVEISAPQAKLAGSAMAEISGGMVKIN